MFAPRHLRTPEPRPDLEGLGGGDGEHRVGEHGGEFVEDGFAESGGNAPDDAGDGATDGVVGFFRAEDALGFELRLGCEGERGER